ncbi:MAG TPA: serine/threonine-protein kinase [Polyangiaceae bacterium]|nr:serine/threonine-protein kinase [Polyangiaceae bacterium]
MAVAEYVAQACFGPYRLVRRVGSGGMGSVFEAEDTGLGHRVALKLLHPHVAERPGAVVRFLREGRAAARIKHPNVVQVLALGTDGDTPYLAMELLEGDDLSHVLARRGRLSVEDALDVLLPVIGAVAAAHEAGVIHRDLKPSNICITRSPGALPWPKVVDFGVSKVITGEGASDATMTDAVIGTAAYMSPEQARAACNASFRSDQYSLAAVLYQCLSGQLPYPGRSVYEIVESALTRVPAPLRDHVAAIPVALESAVLRALSRDPETRFPSVRSFGTALLEFATERTRVALAAEWRAREAGPDEPTGRAEPGGTWATPSITGTSLVPEPGPASSTPLSPSSSRSPLRHALWGLAAILLLAVATLAFGGVDALAAWTRPAASRAPASHGHAVTTEAGPRSLPPTVSDARAASEEVDAPRNPVARPRVAPVRHGAPSAPLAAPVPIGENGAPILP